MSTDVARIYIDSVMLRLGELDGALLGLPYMVGGVAFAENDAPPIVKWAFGDVDHEPAVVGDTIGTEVQELRLRVWAAADDQDASEAATRTLKNKLLLAARQVALAGRVPDPIAFGRFEWNVEFHNVYGRHLEGSILVKFGVPDQEFTTVVVAQAEADIYAVYPDTEAEELVEQVSVP